MNLHRTNKQEGTRAIIIQRFPLAKSSDRNNQTLTTKLKELESEFISEELKLIDELINIVLVNSKRDIGLEVLKQLQEASGIDPKCFFYFEPNMKATGGNKRPFLREELKLSLLEAILMSKDMPPFIFEKLRLKFSLIIQALNRDVCFHGCEVWRKLISKVCYTLDINPKDLTDDQIIRIINYVDKKKSDSTTTMMYLEIEDIPSNKLLEYFLNPKDLKEIRTMLKIAPKGRSFTAEELEKAQRFIAVGGSCAVPL